MSKQHGWEDPERPPDPRPDPIELRWMLGQARFKTRFKIGKDDYFAEVTFQAHGKSLEMTSWRWSIEKPNARKRIRAGHAPTEELAKRECAIAAAELRLELTQ